MLNNPRFWGVTTGLTGFGIACMWYVGNMNRKSTFAITPLDDEGREHGKEME